MICPKCGSNNVTASIVSDTKSVNKHHSLLWKICIGWWWIPFKWLFFTLFAFIVRLFGNNRHKIVTEHTTMCVCQTCGYTWKASSRGGHR